MGSIFSGLVQCGAWGCFDEFNRIEAEVLSVVSSQIRQIQEALKNGFVRFQFEGKVLLLCCLQYLTNVQCCCTCPAYKMHMSLFQKGQLASRICPCLHQ